MDIFLFEIFPTETFLSRGNLREMDNTQTHSEEKRKTSSIFYGERERERGLKKSKQLELCCGIYRTESR